MNDSRVCVCSEKGAMVEFCHQHHLPEVEAEGVVEELNEKYGYPKYWTLSYCPDVDDSVFHHRGGY